MSRFILSAQLQLIPPTNARQIVNLINSQLQGVSVSINVAVNNNSLNAATRNITNARRAAQGLGNDMERFGEQAAIAIRRYGAFTLATGAFLKLTQAIGAGIDDAIKFDREIVRIAQVTGQSTGSLKGLSNEVTRLSTTFGVASEEILESAVTLSQAGLSAKETQIALEALAKTGVSATFGDIKETTEAAIAAMQQFGYGAKDLEGILGSINSVSAAFAVESDDIAIAIRRAGGAFQAAGGNLNEFQALFTSVRQTTRESAESIATGFRTIFARLQRVRTQNFLKDLGIDVLNEQGLFVGPFEAIRRLSTALKDLNSTDPRFAQVIEELGGFRQVSKVIPLIEKFDVSQKALNVAIRGGSSLSKDAATAQEALGIQIAKVREEFTALVREIANNETFRSLIKFSLSLASSFIKVADALTPLLPLIAILSASKIGANLGDFKRGFARRITGFASGGPVPGSGNGDTVPAMLTPGEFVIRKSAAQAFGYENLHRVNRYADGDIVKKRKQLVFPGQEDRLNEIESEKLKVSQSKIRKLRRDKETGARVNLNPSLLDKKGAEGQAGRENYDFGMVVLDPVGANQDVTAVLNNAKIAGFGEGSANMNIHIRGLRKDLASQIKKNLDKELRATVTHGASLITEAIQSGKPGPVDFTRVPIDGVIGTLFESTLLTAGAPYEGTEKPGRNLDFPMGIGAGLQQVFEPAQTITGVSFGNIPADAKNRNSGGNLGSMFDKAIKHVLDERKKARAPALPEKANENRVAKPAPRIVDLSKENPFKPFENVASGTKITIEQLGENLKLQDLRDYLKKNPDTAKLFQGVRRGSFTGFQRTDIERKNTGGFIDGPGSGDTVPALLTPGEFVINKESAQKIGYSTLNKINRGNNVSRFARGGVARFNAGGRANSSLINNSTNIGLGLTVFGSFIQGITGADTEIGKLTSSLATLGGQIALTSSLYKEGSRTVAPFLERFSGKFNANTAKARGQADNLRGNLLARDTQNAISNIDNKAVGREAARRIAINRQTFGPQSAIQKRDVVDQVRRDQVNSVVASGQAERDRLSEELFTSRKSRFDARTRQKNTVRANRLAVGGAVVGAVGSFAGGFLQDSASEDLSRGIDSSRKFTTGGTISGASTGAAIGSIAGAPGIIIGGFIGAIAGYTSSIKEAEKTLRGVKFNKELEGLGQTINRISKGVTTADSESINVSSSIQRNFGLIASTSGPEKNDLIAQFKNQSSGVEDFFIQIAKSSKSLDEFNQKTGNSLDEFAAISDIPYGDLRTQIENTIKAEVKAKDALLKLSQATRASNDLRVVFDSFSTALVKASLSLQDFDSTLDRLDAGVDFTGAKFKSFDISSIFKASANNEFNDPNQIGQLSKNLLGNFGGAGNQIAGTVSDISKARALVPDLIRQFASSPLRGEEAAPQDFVANELKKAGIGEAVIQAVTGGITGVIGGEAKPSRLLEKFQADPTSVTADIFDSLKGFDGVMADFAGKISDHNNRVGRLFEISAKIQTKVNDLEIQKTNNIIALEDKILANLDRPISVQTGRARDQVLNQQIAGTNNVSTANLFARANTAQKNIAGLDNTIVAKERQGLDIQGELKARQQNIQILEKSTAALERMTKEGYEFAALEERLSRAGEERRFKRDNIELQAFGSTEDKKNQAQAIQLVTALVRGNTRLSSLNDEGKSRVSSFLTENAKVNFKGLGGLSGEDIKKRLLVRDQAEKLQQFEGLSPQAAAAKAEANVKEAFEGTKQEEQIRKEMLRLTQEQNGAITALQSLLNAQDPLKTNLLTQENNRFLGELNNVLISGLITAEKVKATEATNVLERAKGASGLPDIDVLKNAEQRKVLLQQISEVRNNTLGTQSGFSKSFAEAEAALSNASTDKEKNEILKGLALKTGLSENDIGGLQGNTGSTLFDNGATRGLWAQGLSINTIKQLSNAKLIEQQGIQTSALEKQLQQNTKPFIPLPEDFSNLPEKDRKEAEKRREQAIKQGSVLENMPLEQIRRNIEIKQSAPTPADVMRAQNQSAVSTQSLKELEKNIRPPQTVSAATPNNPAGRIDGAINGMNQFANKLEGTVNQMDGLQMELVANHRVEVILNGAEVLSRMNEDFQSLVTRETSRAIRKLVEENNTVLKMPVA